MLGGHWYAGDSLPPSHLSLCVTSLSLSLSHIHVHTHVQSPCQDGPQAANPSPQMLDGSVEKVNDKDDMYTCTCMYTKCLCK